MAKRKILLVDDEKDLAGVIRTRLESQGYELLTAYDGKAGLDVARKENPHLIILDIMLPKIDGYNICRMLKFDEKYKNIPIIMLTARVLEADMKTGQEVGADIYMTKPFHVDELLKNIEQLLGVESDA